MLVAGVGCGSLKPSDPQTESQDALEQQVQASARKREAGRLKAERDAAAKPPVAPQQSTGSGALFTESDRADFAQLAARLPGSEGIAVALVGKGAPVSQVGDLTSGVAWSTAKVPVAMAAISAGVGSQSDLVSAITASDNAAAERLWSALGAGAAASSAATAQLRSSGDAQTVIQPRRLRAGFTPFGQTDWSLANQVRVAGSMACSAAGKQVLQLMADVVSGQRWGLGGIGNSPQFKGGWGPGVSPGQGDGWLERQMGRVTLGGHPVAIAIATTAPDHSSGMSALGQLAKWAETHVHSSSGTGGQGC